MSILTLLRAPSATIALVLFTQVTSPAATDFASCYPDSAVAYVEAPDLAKFGKLADHPLGKIVASDELKKAVTAMLEDDEDSAKAITRAEKMLKEETGLTWQELLTKFPGGLSAALFDLELKPGPGSNSDYKLGAVADFSGDEKLVERLISAMERLDEKETPLENEYDVSSADYEGVKLHVLKEKEPEDKDSEDSSEYAWAVADGKLYFGNGEETVRDLLDSSSGRRTANLANTAEFRALADGARPADVFVAGLSRGLIKHMLKLAAEEEDEPEEAAMVAKITTALGIESFYGLSVRLHFGESHLDMDLTIPFESRPALLNLWVTDGTGPAPSFIPPEASEANYGTLVLPEIWKNAKSFIGEHLPDIKESVDEALSQFKARSMVDVETDLLAHLGKRYFSAAIRGKPADEDDPGAEMYEKTSFPLSGPDDSMVIGFETSDGKAFERSLSTVTESFLRGAFEEREYQGVTIRKFRAAPEGIGMALASTDDWLLLSLGKEDMLEKILGRMASDPGGSKENFWNRPEVKAAVSKLPDADQAEVEYVDVGAQWELLAEVLLEELDEYSTFRDLFRESKLPIVTVSKNYITGKHIQARSRILPKE